MKTKRLVVGAVVAVVVVAVLTLAARHLHAQIHMQGHSGGMASMHAPVAQVSYAELKSTVAELDRAKQATEKYQDARVAEADGYKILGAEFPGMGAHFVLSMEAKGFDIEKPPILLYHKSADVPGGYTLVGLGYLFDAPEGPDGQPVNPPFPKALAHWHQHDNVCLGPKVDNPHSLSESECRAQGGKFVAKTPWLVHVWIWKDNPTGVFTPDNPALH